MLIGDFMTLQIIQSQSSIVYPPFVQPNFQLKTNIIYLFQNGHQFYGRAEENPHTHVSRFLEGCQHFRYQGISNDVIRLRLFSHTLHDKVLEWLDSQPIASISTWNDLAQKFCTKFFPPAKIAKLKHDISIFCQSESFNEAWNRFKNMLHKCSHQGISKGLHVQYFYAGLLPSFKSMVDSSSNGLLSTKTIDKTLKLFDTVVTISGMWILSDLFKRKLRTVNATQAKKLSYEEYGADHIIVDCPIMVQGMEKVDVSQWGQHQQNNQHPDTYNLDEKHAEQTEETTEASNKESSDTPQVRATAPINLYELPILFLQRKLGLGEAKATMITLQLVDRSLTLPGGIVEDVLIKVEKFIFSTEFFILDMERDKDIPLILGRPYLATGKALIDV
ncbi:unnamed protein product [Fraxinus pennsylvanica]|uniref:Retrotransposon gag domain-containing protein n=1 Tax=Fraxinus pennsylvanica TaxID=56036 RepID=A0AAD2E3I2_9LAMI|nr:unnamed protein product [Fraxinus pennsylvanica]